MDQYVADQVANGPFNNASEVVRDALRLHQLHYIEVRQRIDGERDLRKWQEADRNEERGDLKPPKAG